MSPMQLLKRKSLVVPPPIEMGTVLDALDGKPERDGTALFVETRQETIEFSDF